MFLAIRTDKPLAELYILDQVGNKVAEHQWLADRQLADHLHVEIKKILKKNKLTFDNLTGIVVFEGPGSFTGLRIGITVANALAYSLQIPVIGTNSEKWISPGWQKKFSKPQQYVVPEYGSLPNITHSGQ